MKRNVILIGIISILFLFTSCIQGDENKEASRLEGNWFLQEAYRDNRKTETLNTLFYQFKGEKVVTNLTGSPQYSTFSIENNILKVEDATLPTSYNTLFLNDSLLELETKIQNTSFRFVLFKKDSTLLQGI